MIGCTKFLGMTILKNEVFYAMADIDANIAPPQLFLKRREHRAYLLMKGLSTLAFKKSIWDDVYFGNYLWKIQSVTIPYHCVKLKL